MDPNKVLADILRLAQEALEDGIQDTPETCTVEALMAYLERADARALELSEHVISLDLWLAQGGFRPARWLPTEGGES